MFWDYAFDAVTFVSPSPDYADATRLDVNVAPPAGIAGRQIQARDAVTGTLVTAVVLATGNSGATDWIDVYDPKDTLDLGTSYLTSPAPSAGLR